MFNMFYKHVKNHHYKTGKPIVAGIHHWYILKLVNPNLPIVATIITKLL